MECPAARPGNERARGVGQAGGRFRATRGVQPQGVRQFLGRQGAGCSDAEARRGGDDLRAKWSPSRPTSSRASTTDAGSPKCGHGGSCVRPLSSLSRRPCRTACRRSTRSPRSRLLRARLRRWTICLSKDGAPTGYIAETVRKRATVCSLSYRLSFPARLPVLCRVRIRVACLRRAGSEPGKEQAGSDMKR